ncbi:hypothetical protein KQI63_02380 [bacterium]|nr:hypothetical protein [bacterium]
MMREQIRTFGEQPQQSTLKEKVPAGYRGVYAVPTTPYSVFVHRSPVYITSELPQGKRPGRPSARTRVARGLPFRPDGYPYASRRYSRHLMREQAALGGGGEA